VSKFNPLVSRPGTATSRTLNCHPQGRYGLHQCCPSFAVTCLVERSYVRLCLGLPSLGLCELRQQLSANLGECLRSGLASVRRQSVCGSLGWKGLAAGVRVVVTPPRPLRADLSGKTKGRLAFFGRSSTISGGRLWATAAQSQGATFQFTLPE
jgi:hypothetical protein